MSLGREVNKGILDMRAAEAVLELRSALDKGEAVAKWLANHPKPADGLSPDPLTLEPFLYTDDEVYVLRSFFEQVDAIRVANTALIDTGRKMTGLE